MERLFLERFMMEPNYRRNPSTHSVRRRRGLPRNRLRLFQCDEQSKEKPVNLFIGTEIRDLIQPMIAIETEGSAINSFVHYHRVTWL